MRRSVIAAVLSIALFEGALRAAAPIPAKDGSLSAQEATVLAEKFVAEQRFNDLQPKAVGARAESDLWFVGFHATVGDGIRGIVVMQNGKKLKRVSQNLKLDWLMSKPEDIKPVGEAEARAMAEKLAKATKGLPKKAAKATENKANPAGDPWNSWWVWFEKAAKPGVKAPSYSIISINKETREMKWIKSTGKTVSP